MTSAPSVPVGPPPAAGRAGWPGGPAGRPPRRRRALRIAGIAFLVAGVGILLWIAWQLWVTTWLSQRHQAEIIGSLEQGWSQGQQEVRVDVGTGIGILRVPRFGADYEVPVLAGTSDDVLAAGVGHQDGTAMPGERGNMVLAGHVITHGEPFRHLKDLRVGDEVDLETAQGTYHYVIDTPGDALTVDFSAGWVLDPRPVNPDPAGVDPTDDPRLLTLLTCAELFHTDLRTVVFGHQTGFDPAG